MQTRSTAPLHQTATVPHRPHVGAVPWATRERGSGPPLPCEVCAAVAAAHLPYAASLPQGTSRPTRSLSTAQLAQPTGGLQASVISNIVLMKGQAKVSKGHCQQKPLDGHMLPRSCPVRGRKEPQPVVLLV